MGAVDAVDEMKTIAFFNPKGGVGKTTLVWHLAWMLRRLGLGVVAIDLDPQANLTAALLGEERARAIGKGETIAGWRERRGARGNGEEGAALRVEVVERELFGPDLGVVAAEAGLAGFEERLEEAWRAGAGEAVRVTTAFHEAAREAGAGLGAKLVLLDTGPGLGAIQRAALVAADHVVVPVGADLFSLQGLERVGAALRRWRGEWQSRRAASGLEGGLLPAGEMAVMGYVVVQHGLRRDCPVHAYERWMQRIADELGAAVVGEGAGAGGDEARWLLGAIRHYRSLAPLSQEQRKPMFELTASDGASGGLASTVSDCRGDFEALARRIAARCGVAVG